MYKKSSEFSKTLLKQESALIWIMSLSFIILAFYCIHEGFTGSLPWLAAMVGFPWTAYGVSQAMYYRKSMKENTTGGIKYETVLEEARRATEAYQNAGGFDFSMYDSGIDPFANATKTTSVTYEVTENVDEY
jgi:hypothetical protein